MYTYLSFKTTLFNLSMKVISSGKEICSCILLTLTADSNDDVLRLHSSTMVLLILAPKLHICLFTVCTSVTMQEVYINMVQLKCMYMLRRRTVIFSKRVSLSQQQHNVCDIQWLWNDDGKKFRLKWYWDQAPYVTHLFVFLVMYLL